MEKEATVIWKGKLKEGSGTVTTESDALSSAVFGYGARCADQAGTNPEELIAAAHATCYSMTLANELEKQGLTPDRLKVTDTVTLQRKPEGLRVTSIRLDVVGAVEGADSSMFIQAAEIAKDKCPITQLLKAPIELDAQLESQDSEIPRSGAA